MPDCNKNATNPAEMERFLASCTNLPSLPSVVMKIINASKDPDISLADVAEILRVDPALSAKLLRIANSPLYARRREISSLRDALSLLGLDAALTISLSFSLVNSLSCSADNKVNYNDFWKRSILSATIARQLGLTLKLPNLEDFFLASLLQDIGILAINCSTSHSVDPFVSSHANRINIKLEDTEFDHSEIGACLLRSWNLPEKLYTAVSYSNINNAKPAQNPEDEIFYQCIRLSGDLADIWFSDDHELAIEHSFNSIEQLLGFDQEHFNIFINEISDLLPEISNLFEIKIVDDKMREQVISEARSILMEHNLNIIKKFDDHRNQIDSLTERTRNIEEAASRDHLTGAHNRKHIEQLLDQEFDTARKDHEPLSLAFIDLDDFKVINDTYGHLAGDKVLLTISNFFQTNIRDTDMLARYGGDEFLLMLPNTSSEIAVKLLNRLINELKNIPEIKYDNKVLNMSVSIGVATYTSNNSLDNLENLISAADKALYKAKQTGKNKIMSN